MMLRGARTYAAAVGKRSAAVGSYTQYEYAALTLGLQHQDETHVYSAVPPLQVEFHVGLCILPNRVNNILAAVHLTV